MDELKTVTSISVVMTKWTAFQMPLCEFPRPTASQLVSDKLAAMSESMMRGRPFPANVPGSGVSL